MYHNNATLVCMENLIAYEGKYFTLEWYQDDKGKSQAQKYYAKLTTNQRFKVIALFARMANIGEIKNITKFRNEGDKIFSFKPQPDRFLCFFVKDKKIIITNAFRKKTTKLPASEKKIAMACRNNFLNK